MKPFIYIICVAVAAVLLCACNDDENYGDERQDVLSEIVLEAPGDPISRNNAGKDSLLTDGSAIQDIAVFICKEGGSVEAYRQLSLDCTGENTAAKSIKFTLTESDKNADGWAVREPHEKNVTDSHSLNVESQGQGVYEVYAVANYMNNAEIKGIISDANYAADSQSGSGLDTQLARLKNSKVLSSDGLYNASDNMILSLHDRILVSPGEHTYHSSMMRSCARIRVTIRNECVKYKITISDLKLGVISRASIPLFASDDISEQSPDTEPVLTSNKAVKSFGEVTINENVPVDKNGKQTYDNQAVVFDGYILENSSPDGYDFKLTAMAETGGVSDSKTEYEFGLNAKDMVKGKDNYYLITSYDEKYVLYNSGAGNLGMVARPSFEGMKEDAAGNYIWIYDGTNIYPKSNPDLHIITNDNGVSPVDVPVTLGTDNNESPLIAGSGHIYWEGNLGYDVYYGEEYTYFYIDQNIKWRDTGSESYGFEYEAGSLPYYSTFYFVPVKIKTTHSGPLVSTQTFPFTKMVNKKPREVTEIRRNDFYHVFINVRYNEKLGAFDFEVNRWNEGGGDIEFY